MFGQDDPESVARSAQAPAGPGMKSCAEGSSNTNTGLEYRGISQLSINHFGVVKRGE